MEELRTGIRKKVFLIFILSLTPDFSLSIFKRDEFTTPTSENKWFSLASVFKLQQNFYYHCKVKFTCF